MKQYSDFVFIDYSPFKISEFCEKIAKINRGESEKEEITTFDGRVCTITKEGVQCEGEWIWPFTSK